MVGIEPAVRKRFEALSVSTGDADARGTHKCCSKVRLPRLDGIVPLSWLAAKYLRECAEALSIQRRCHNAAGTHMFCSAVRLPRLDGMVPLSRLPLSELRAGGVAAFSGVQ